MKQFKIKENYLLLKKWWESIDLTNYERIENQYKLLTFKELVGDFRSYQL